MTVRTTNNTLDLKHVLQESCGDLSRVRCCCMRVS